MATGKRGRVTIKLQAEGAERLLSGFADLPQTLQNTVSDRSVLIAQTEVRNLQQAARGDTAQAKLIAPSIKVTTAAGGFPAFTAGGSGRIPGGDGARYGDVFFGAEFGGQNSRATMQFRPHQGKTGYWLFPTLRSDMDEIVAAYEVALDQAENSVFGGDR